MENEGRCKEKTRKMEKDIKKRQRGSTKCRGRMKEKRQKEKARKI